MWSSHNPAGSRGVAGLRLPLREEPPPNAVLEIGTVVEIANRRLTQLALPDGSFIVSLVKDIKNGNAFPQVGCIVYFTRRPDPKDACKKLAVVWHGASTSGMAAPPPCQLRDQRSHADTHPPHPQPVATTFRGYRHEARLDHSAGTSSSTACPERQPREAQHERKAPRERSRSR